MSLADLYASGEHKNNLGHFANIVHLAAIDGIINIEEDTLMHKLAKKLGVSDSEFKEVVSSPSSYPIVPAVSKTDRLEKLYDFFKIIYADHQCDEEEMGLLRRYAIAIGFTEDQSIDIIAKSLKIFEGRIGFDDYEYLVSK